MVKYNSSSVAVTERDFSDSSLSSWSSPLVSSASSIAPGPELNIGPNGLTEPIAIIGIGCRLPGLVDSPSSLWNHLMSETISNSEKVPSSRFNINSYYHQNKERPGSIAISGGYFLNSTLKEFDPTAFGISPVEALWMEPQQRKLLEVVYEAFENCGATLESISGTATGCYVGNFTADYQQMIFKEPDFRHSYAATGIDPGICSNRISNVFNLNGPSLVLNTACSSTMYALHTACSSLLTGGCEGAIVAGTNLILTIDQHMNTAKLGILSPTNVCHAFDAAADGYGRGEAVGALYIKKLSDALKNGDPIRAVIRSTAVNSNGKIPEAGITSPNIGRQVAVMKTAHERANLDPNLTSYIETHGTGTAVGDPVEARAVSLAMRTKDSSERPIMIGSVKPNLGHSEAASSIPTIIKSILAIENGVIPATAGVSKPNPNIHWDDWNLKLVAKPTPFPASTRVRRIGVNAFGYGGTNAHCIIENVEHLVPNYQGHKSVIQMTRNKTASSSKERPHLLTFSAHDKATLARNITAYSEMSQEPDLVDLAYTLAIHRTKHKHRCFTVSNKENSESQLQGAMATATEFGSPAVTAFVFTGQSAQWPGMAVSLLENYPVFANTIRLLDSALASLKNPPDWAIHDILLEQGAASRISNPQFSQPLCTAVQIGLVDLLRSWNVLPVAAVGHSSGEIAASYAAGFLSAEEAITAAYYRGKSMCSATKNGAMLAVGLGGEDVKKYVERYEGRVVVACYNSPKSVTLSGDIDAIEELESTFTADGTFARILKTGGMAYHNQRHMMGASQAYENDLNAAATRESERWGGCQMVSSVTAKIIADGGIEPGYWIRNLVSPVLFNQALVRMLKEIPSVSMIIEIGPHSALAGPVRDICTNNGFSKVQYASTLMRGKNDAEQLLGLAGTLWARESSIDIRNVIKVETISEEGLIEETQPTLLVDLPPYQWNYAKNTWLEPPQSREHRSQIHPRHDILGRRIAGLASTEPCWQNVLRHKDLPWLKHHSLGGEAVLAGASYFAMAFEALAQVNSDAAEPVPIHGFKLRDISIQSALVIPDNLDGVSIVFSLRPSQATSGVSSACISNEEYIFSVASQSNSTWITHMTGVVSLNPRKKGPSPAAIPTLTQCVSGRSWYQRFNSVGFEYGTSFQELSNVRSDGMSHHATANSRIKTSSGLVDGESRYFLHPASIDIPIQLIMVAIYDGKLNDVTCGMTVSTSREISIWIPSEEQLQNGVAKAHAWTTHQGQRVFLANSQLVAEDGQILVDIVDMRCTSYEAAVPANALEGVEEHQYTTMEWKEDVDNFQFREAKLSAKDFVGLLLHKNAALRILNVDSPIVSGILARHPDVNITSIAKNEISQQPGTAAGLYDLLLCSEIALEQDSDQKKLSALLVPGGRAIVSGNLQNERLKNSLKQGSFSTSDHVFHDDGDETSILIATPKGSPNGTNGKSASHVALMYWEKPSTLFNSILEKFVECGYQARSCAIDNFEHHDNEQVIILADLERHVLATLQENELASLKNLVDSAKSIIWVTCGGLLRGETPECALSLGLARTLTLEQLSLDLITIDVDPSSCSDEKIGRTILNIAERQRDQDGPGENEFLLDNDKLYISRLVPDRLLNVSSNSDETLVSIEDSLPLKAVLKGRKIFFHQDERATKSLQKDQVEIKVAAIGLNQEDNHAVTGSDYLPHFTHEIAGTILAVGTDVQNLKIGDRVIGFCFDECGTNQRTLGSLVKRIPDTASFEDMATIPMAFATALYGLQSLARVVTGEVVIILNGGSAAIAALQICRFLGLHGFILTKNSESLPKFQRLGVSTEEHISIDDNDLTTLLARYTNGKGIDVLFGTDSTDLAILSECSNNMAPFGRCVTFGRRDPSRPFASILSITPGFSRFSFDIVDLYDQRPAILSKLLEQSLEFYNAAKFVTFKPVSIISVSDIEAAIRSYSDDSSDGKSVISLDPKALLKVIPTQPQVVFSADYTYLLAGCLGGLGRSLTSWMVERGARRLAFISRSGTDSPSAALLVKNILAKGVDVTVLRCDITSKADTERVLTQIDPKYPIRGVVNAAMVLDDGLFRNMTLDRWKTPLHAKVQGSKNLHEIFQDTELEFFVMTSSVSGTVGTPGQSNYAAANTYLDALARHRRFRGLHGMSLVLPMILGIGYVSEHVGIEEKLEKRGMYGIYEDEVIAAFGVAMAPQPDLTHGRDHIVVGLDPTKLAKVSASNVDNFWLGKPRFHTLAAMIAVNGTTGAGSTSNDSIAGTINSLENKDEAVAFITKCLIVYFSELLFLEGDDFLPDLKSVASYGLDSMIGADVRNWIFREFHVDMSFQELLSPILTITKLSERLLEKFRTCA